MYPTSNSKHVPKVSTDPTNGDSEKKYFPKKIFSRTRGYFMMRYMYLVQYTLHTHVFTRGSNVKLKSHNKPKVISKVVLTLLTLHTYVRMHIGQVAYIKKQHQIVLLCKPYQEEYIFNKCCKSYFCLVTWDQIDIVMWFLSYLSSQEPISIWFDGFELCNTKYSTNANLKHLDVFVAKYNLWIANVGEIVK